MSTRRRWALELVVSAEIAAIIALSLLASVANRLLVVTSQKLVLTFVLPTGLFKGNFTPAGATRAVPFAGAVLQGENFNWASGYFLGTSQSGRVLLQAPAP